jgi:molecular chaperone Hsp33
VSEAGDDLVLPFQVDKLGLRGRLVRLGPALDDMLHRHAYPEPVAAMLGEALVLAAALGSMLKYDGAFTLQTKGDGPIRLLVADVTADGGLRGYAQHDPARLQAAASRAGGAVPRLLGAGHLAFTVDQGPDTERYQGIVELAGPSLADCLHHYFRQSEQTRSALHPAVGQPGGGPWRAGAIVLQRLPRRPGEDPNAVEDAWRQGLALVGSVRSSELLDPGLAPKDLLWRLFHDQECRVFRLRRLHPACRCSEARVARMLRGLPRGEIEDLKVDGALVVTCEFCNRVYRFDAGALDEVYAAAAP